MISTKVVLFLFLTLFSLLSYAAITPSDPVPAKGNFQKVTVKEVERLTGKKLNFFQKLQLRLVQSKPIKKLLRLGDEPMTERQKKWAEWSLILGLSSIALFFVAFIPYVSILALLMIPASILAVIFGIKSLKGNSNTKGIIGIVTGGSVILITVIGIIWLLSSFSWGWG